MLITFFYVPVSNAIEAQSLGALAVQEHLAACANFFPVQSVFPWHGRIQEEHEFVLVLKTLPALKNKLSILLESKHSYDTPCILHWEGEVNETYGKWMLEQLGEINPPLS